MASRPFSLPQITDCKIGHYRSQLRTTVKMYRSNSRYDGSWWGIAVNSPSTIVCRSAVKAPAGSVPGSACGVGEFELPPLPHDANNGAMMSKVAANLYLPYHLTVFMTLRALWGRKIGSPYRKLALQETPQLMETLNLHFQAYCQSDIGLLRINHQEARVKFSGNNFPR